MSPSLDNLLFTTQGMLSANKGQLNALSTAKSQPYVLDDKIISRLLQVFKDQKQEIQKTLNIANHWTKVNLQRKNWIN